MSLSQSSQYSRIINRRLRSPCDSVWIPQSAPANAFEQCCSVSGIAFRRHGSNVPGPMENRRRLGKRHMGELNLGQTHPPLPLWELANSVDLTQWKWKPPKSSFSDHSPQVQDGVTTSWGIVRDWLGVSSRDASTALPASPQMMWEPKISARGAIGHVMPINASSAVHKPDDRSNILPFPITVDFNLDIEDPARTVEQAIHSLTLDASSESNLQTRANFGAFCCKLQQVIARQRVSGHGAYTVVKDVSSGLKQHIEALKGTDSSTLVRTLTIQLYTAALDGLAQNYARHGSRFLEFQLLYATLLLGTSELRGNTLRILERIMSDIPQECVGNFTMEIVSNISNFLVALSRPYDALPTSGRERTNIMRQINKMADCLVKLDSTVHHSILEEVTAQLCRFSELGISNFKTMRFCWLQVVARLPNVQDEFLSRLCASLEAGVTVEPLSSNQICGIFLGRLNSHLSPKHIFAIYEVLKHSSNHDCYARLSSKLWQTHQARYIKKLCIFLIQLDRRQDIVQLTKGLRKHVKNDSTPLANLAIGLGHPQLALWIYIRYHQSRWKSKIFWNTGFATEVLTTLLNVKDMRSEKILDVLKILPVQRRQPPRRTVSLGPGKRIFFESHGPSASKPSKRQIQKIERAALAFADAPSISNRMALTRISQCIQYLQSHNTPIPPRILGAVFHIITRDLAAGRPGRTTRLRWFLNLLLKEDGLDKVLEAALILKRWRDVLYQAELRSRKQQSLAARH